MSFLKISSPYKVLRSWKLLFTISLFINITVFAQTIQIVDSISGIPLDVVHVYSKTSEISEYSTKNGVVDLNRFQPNELLFFEHHNYKIVVIKKSEIKVKSQFRLTKQVDEEALQNEQISIKNTHIEHPLTSAELLQLKGNVQIEKHLLGGGNPLIRGFESNKIVLILDGVRLNNAIYGGSDLHNFYAIDNSVLNNTRIIYGLGSSNFGSDAFGGTINFHTIDPNITHSDTAYFHGSSFIHYNNNNNLSGNFNFSIGKNKWGLLSSFTASSFGDTKMGKNRYHGDPNWGLQLNSVERINGVDSVISNADPNLQIGSGYQQFNFTEKFVYAPTTRFKITFNFQYSTTSKINHYGKLAEYNTNSLRYSEWYYGPQDRLFSALKFDFKSDSKWFDKGVVIFSFQKADQSQASRKFGSNWKNHQDEAVSVLGLNVDFKKRIKKTHTINYGFEIQDNRINSTAYEQNILSGEQHAAQTLYPFSNQYLNAGIYLEYQQKMNRKNVLMTGIRYSYIYAQSALDSSILALPFNAITISTGAPTGHFGMLFKPKKNTAFKALISSGFRAPNIADYGRFDEKNKFTIIPNNTLEPEYAIGGELSFNQTVDKANIEFSGTIYSTYLINALVLADYNWNGNDSAEFNGEITKIRAIQNTENAIIYGINLSTTIYFTSEISLFATYNYTKGTDLSNNAPLSNIAPQFGRVSLNYDKNNWNTAFTTFYNFRKKLADYPPLGDAIELTPNSTGTPPWWTLNYRLSYTFAETITAQLAIQNILDVHYRPFASGISAPGRNFMIGLHAKF